MRYEEVSFKACDLYMCQPLDLYLFQRTVLKTDFSFNRHVCVSLSLWGSIELHGVVMVCDEVC